MDAEAELDQARVSLKKQQRSELPQVLLDAPQPSRLGAQTTFNLTVGNIRYRLRLQCFSDTRRFGAQPPFGRC